MHLISECILRLAIHVGIIFAASEP